MDTKLLSKGGILPFTKIIMSEREYKPMHDKYGRDRCCQWQIENREKISIKEALNITNIITNYCEIRGRSPSYRSLKECVKSRVVKHRKEKKTVKWADNVEIFEEKFRNDEQRNMVWNYRKTTKCVEISSSANNNEKINISSCTKESIQGLIDLNTTSIAISSTTTTIMKTSLIIHSS